MKEVAAVAGDAGGMGESMRVGAAVGERPTGVVG